MKKLILLTLSLFFAMTVSAQTEKGNWLFEVGSTPFGENTIMQGNSTGLALFSTDGTTLFSIGAEGGYFVQDNTALKFGLGYTDLDFTTFFTYKFGMKHYANGVVPLQLDITGAVNEDQEDFFGGGTVETPDPLWLGLQAGYAAFLGENISFEPTLRYNMSLNDDFTDEDIIELRFNFVVFF